MGKGPGIATSTGGRRANHPARRTSVHGAADSGPRARVTALFASHRLALAGLLGAVMLLGGLGTYLSLQTPAYARPDESAHVGYLIELRNGSLPTIDTPVPTDTAAELAHRVAGESDAAPHRQDIYTANNPPFAYLAALPLAEIGSALDVPSPDLLAMRLSGVIAGMFAVVLTYLLADELSGGDQVTSVAAAGLVAGTVGVALALSLAYLDGAAFAATTGLTWAVARAARSAGPGELLHVGVWAALAAAVRPMSAAFAGAAVVIVAFLAWRARGRRVLPGAILRLAGPAMVLTGWFYALNMRRYGDPTGSEALFEKLQRAPAEAGFLGFMLHPTWLGRGFQDLIASDDLKFLTIDLARTRGEPVPDPFSGSVAAFVALALVVLALVLVLRSGARAVGPTERRPLVPGAWVATVGLVAVPIALVAQHMASSGFPHPRYLLPLVPVAASAAILVARRIGGWVPLVGVGAFTIWTLARLGHVVEIRQRPSLGATQPLAGQPLVGRVLAVTILGAVLLVAGLAYATWRTRRPMRDRTPAASSRPKPEPQGR